MSKSLDTEIERDEGDISVHGAINLGNMQAYSPSSSSSSAASKTTNDTTFEPSVDMMVNDFDDEGTLEEEEKLAEQEAHDTSSELSSLEKESEMPIEELMALYNYVPHMPKKHSRKEKKRKRDYNSKNQHENLAISSAAVDDAANCSSVRLAATTTLQIDTNNAENNVNVTAKSPSSLDFSPYSNENDTDVLKSNKNKPKKLLKRRLSMCDEAESQRQQPDLLPNCDDHVFTPPKKVPPRRSSSVLSSSNQTTESDKPVRRRLSDFEDRAIVGSPEKLKANLTAKQSSLFKETKSPTKRSSAYSSLMKPSATSPNLLKRGENNEKGCKKQIKEKRTLCSDNVDNVNKVIESLKCGKSVGDSKHICVNKGEERNNDAEEQDVENDADDDDEDENDDNDDEDDDDIRIVSSNLRHLYPETYGDKKSRRSDSKNLTDDEDEIDDDYNPEEEEDIKKTIMVGSEFQASIPEGFSKYDDALPYENEDKLLWDPNVLEESVVESFLTSYQDLKVSQQMSGMPSNKSHSSLSYIKIVEILPEGNHLKDDEQALLLLSQCGHDIDEALRRKCINAVPTIDSSSWSTEECRNFESGIRTFGKDFHTIKQQKVRTRAVGEIVQFYYLWKKTDRHDMFANKARLDKRKYCLKPGVTEYMDRFLEEQDNGSSSNGGNGGLNGVRDRSASPSNVVAGPSSTKLYVGLGSSPMKLSGNNNKLSHNISIMNNEKKIHNNINRNNIITGINKIGSNYNYQNQIKNLKGFSNKSEDDKKEDMVNIDSEIQ